MSFDETYHHEVLKSRRTRSDRARFWAKVVSFVLMITFAATLRSEPQLRNALVEGGTQVVLSLTGKTAAYQPQARQPQAAMPDMQQLQKLIGENQFRFDQSPGAKPPVEETGIKVNRSGVQSGPRFIKVNPGKGSDPMVTQPNPLSDVAGTSNQIGELIRSIGANGF